MTDGDDIAACRWGSPFPPSMTPQTNHTLVSPSIATDSMRWRWNYVLDWHDAMQHAPSFGIYMACFGNAVGDLLPTSFINPKRPPTEVSQHHSSAGAFIFCVAFSPGVRWEPGPMHPHRTSERMSDLQCIILSGSGLMMRHSET